MYVADELAVTVWVWAPPSDQLENAYTVPPRVCGDDALSVLIDPSTTVAWNGVACAGLLLTTSERPGGEDCRINVTVRGLSAMVELLAMLLESVTVSLSSRNEGYS